VPADRIEIVSDQLWWLGANAIGEEATDGSVLLTAGFDTLSDAESAAHHVGDLAPVVEVIADSWWMDAWRQYAVPVEVGQRLLLLPSWVERPETDRIVIELDAGRAFGSGSHPSTCLALAALEDLVEGGEVVADIGSGSGVLSVGSLLLGAAECVAVDVDPVAQAVTAANAVRNGVAGRVAVAGATIEDVHERADIAVANIGAATLVALASQLEALAPVIVLSGLLASQATDVAAAFIHRAAQVSAPMDGWVAMVLRPTEPSDREAN
jgi:ribosomal protein L11 methyltransferase